MSVLLPDNENTLLQQIAQGDHTAFKEMVFRYNKVLYSFIYHLTRSKEQAEEIAQDVFLQIWLTREGLTEIKNFRSYIFVISRNQALNALRSALRRKNQQKKWEEERLVHAPVQDEINPLLQENLLTAAVQQLPSQQQKAWLLSRRQLKKHSEIAVELGVSKETVKKHIQFANASIIKYIENRIDVVLMIFPFIGHLENLI